MRSKKSLNIALIHEPMLHKLNLNIDIQGIRLSISVVNGVRKRSYLKEIEKEEVKNLLHMREDFSTWNTTHYHS